MTTEKLIETICTTLKKCIRDGEIASFGRIKGENTIGVEDLDGEEWFIEINTD